MREKIIVKLFASSWYIFLTYIYDALSHLYQIPHQFETYISTTYRLWINLKFVLTCVLVPPLSISQYVLSCR